MQKIGGVSFYLKYKFIQLPEQPLKLFMPIRVIKRPFLEGYKVARC